MNDIDICFRAILTCISFIPSKGFEFVLALLRTHSEVVIVSIPDVSIPITEFNAQDLTFTICQQMNIFVACTRKEHQCNTECCGIFNTDFN